MEKIRSYVWPCAVFIALLFHPFSNLQAYNHEPDNRAVLSFPDRVHTGPEPSMQKVIRPAKLMEQSAGQEDSIAWQGLGNQQFSDDLYVQNTLEASKTAAGLYFSDFAFNLPIGARVDAFKILVEGYCSDDLDPAEILIGVLDSDGALISTNYANKVSKGKSWPNQNKEKQWKYGIIHEDWLGTIDADFVNSNDWSIVLWIRNEEGDMIELAIDQLSVEIFYTPLYTLCHEDCGVAYIDDEGVDYDYNWILPEGMTISSVPENHHIINFMLTDANYGIKEICVEINAGPNQSITLCREILIRNCTPSSVGDFVWLDANGDGLQDSGELGIEGVTMHLYDQGDELIQSSQTDENGQYLFSELLPGTYYVSADYSGDLLPAFLDQGGDSIPDNAFYLVENELRTGTFTISFDTLYDQADLGLVEPASIGDFVWEDSNANGIQDANEFGIEDIFIQLFKEGTLIDTQSTDESGNYRFDHLYPGTYQLCLGLPEDTQMSSRDATTDESDSDFGIDGCTDDFVLAAGEQNSTIDAGIVLNNAGFGDFVWLDLNENGIQDPSEEGINGIEIKLYGEAGNLVATTFSIDSPENGKGFYSFEQLPPGSYYIEINVPDIYLLSPANAGDDATDSDIDGQNGSGTSETFTLSTDQYLSTIDIGMYYNRGSIGDFVWLDLDENGLQDPGESGFGTMEISLYQSGGQFVSSTTSSIEGNYLFDQLIPGDYYLAFDVPDQYLATLPDEGDESVDSDITNAQGLFTTDLISLGGGEDRLDIDAGVTGKPANIGDFIWLDVNRNGEQDHDEPGMNGLTVQLFDAGNNLLQSQISSDHPTTGDSGYYSFEVSVPGAYYLVLDIPAIYKSTEPGIGSEETDSDLTGDFGPGSSELFLLNYGDLNINLDLGLVYQTASVGDFVWQDFNENGKQDVGEAGLNDMELELYSENGTFIRSTQTDINNNQSGSYLFSDLDPGDYYIQVNLNEDQEATNAYIGSPDEDSDLLFIDGVYRTDVFSLSPGEHRLDLDLGIIDKKSAIEGLVWLDGNEDGIYQLTEEGVVHIEVLLYDENDQYIEKVETDSTGKFEMYDIRAGSYYLQFVFGDQFQPTIFQAGTDQSIDSDINSIIDYGTTPVFTTTPGDTIRNLFGGLVDKPFLLGDRVWLDENEDGIQDENELGLNDVEVRLYDSSGQYIGFTVSDNNPIDGTAGYYAFSNVAEGMYYLRFIANNGYLASPGDVGTDDSIDSDVLNLFGEGTTDTFYYSGMEDILIYDAGFYADNQSAVGDYVWLDQNGNGLQDSAETGLNGVLVGLYKSNGVFVMDTLSTDHPDTGVPGYYAFEELAAGSYYLKVNVPDTMYLTDANLGTDDTVDSDIDGSNGPGSSNYFQLAVGESRTDIDIGLYELASLGDFVWDDENANGIQDTSEAGVNGVLVRLFDVEGTLMASTQTGLHPDTGDPGYYFFENIDPGAYYLKFQLEETAGFSLFNTTTDELDSDVTGAFGEGTTSLFTLQSGEVNRNLDAGISLEGGDINGYIWLDLNSNGIFTINEDGLNSFLVRLMNEDGTQASQIFSYHENTSQRAGYFQFTNVPEGNYYLQFDIPENYEFTNPNEGADDAIDSEVDGSNGPGTTPVFTIVNDQLIDSYNAGAYIPASIGDFAWYDDDQDGLQDQEEPGVPDMQVILLQNGSIPIDTSYTDENGHYAFTGLSQGVYAILFKSIPDYGFTERNVGSDDAIDSDVAFNGKSSLISLAHGAQFTDLDAGLVPLFNLVGNQTWYDKNGDGTYDEEEVPAVDSELSLFNTHDVLIAYTRSDDLGEYRFYNLKPGEYYLKASVSENQKEGEGLKTETEMEKEVVTHRFLVDYDSYIEDQDIGFKPVKTDQSTGDPEEDLIIFPNPFQSSITIDLTQLETRPDAILITDLAGNQVYKQQISLFQRELIIDLSFVPTDNYLVNIKRKNRILVQQMIYKSEK